MSEIKRAIERDNPQIFGPQDRAFLTDQSDTDIEMFMAAVDEQIDKIIEREGNYHVSGIFYSNLEDAAIQRQLLAERHVREAAWVRRSA